VDYSAGLEGRTYYDIYTGPRDHPIAPGASLTFQLGPNIGNIENQVRAIVFQDGSSDGDPTWINVIFARRVRLYDRLLALQGLLQQHSGTGISREQILALLRHAQANDENQSQFDDLQVLDKMLFQGAISTFDNRDAAVDTVMRGYLKHLEQRAVRLEQSKPPLELIRTRLSNRPHPDQPIVPPPLSQ
jgi:hypothetical protein